MSNDSSESVDVLIVGGGPVGLSLAIGLVQRGFDVLVVEKTIEAGQRCDFSKERKRGEKDEEDDVPEVSGAADWSKSYTLGINARGVSLLDELGLSQELDHRGLQSTETSLNIWKTDGSVVNIGGRRMTGGSTKRRRYGAQRNQLMEILFEYLQQTSRKMSSKHRNPVLHGTVQSIDFPGDSKAEVSIRLPDGTTRTISCHKLIGCDGVRSIVRKRLAQIDRSFHVKSVYSPSAGLILRTIIGPGLPNVPPKQPVIIKGRTRHSLTMLSFYGTFTNNDKKRLASTTSVSEARPYSMARRSNFFLYQCKTVEEFYAKMDQEFPQLKASESISASDVRRFIQSKGTTFTKPTWSRKAASIIGGVPVVIVGDALHSFGPDIGEGLNSGFQDVKHLLDVLNECRYSNEEDVSKKLASFSKERVKEAESICRIIPIANPYQYNLSGLSDRIGKQLFMIGMQTRSRLYNASNRISNVLRIRNFWFKPPVTALIMTDPPLPYSEILRQYRWNSAVLYGSFVAVILLCGKTFRSSWFRAFSHTST